MDWRDRLFRDGGAGASRLGRAVPLRRANLALTGGGERDCGSGPPEEAGRNTKEARRGSLFRFGGLERCFENIGSSSFGELIAYEVTTFCSRVFVDKTPLVEYPEGDTGLSAMDEFLVGV